MSDNLKYDNTLLSEVEQRLSQRLDRDVSLQLERLNSERQSFESLKRAAFWSGSIVFGIISLIGWLGYQNYNQLIEQLKNQTDSVIANRISSGTSNAKELEELSVVYKDSIGKISQISEQIEKYEKGFSDIRLSDDFDPLLEYYSLSNEIDTMIDLSKSFFSGSSDVSVEQTYYDPAFRRKASIIFKKIEESVVEDNVSGNIRIGNVNLFNAAADASRMDLDFVALGLMEQANKIDKNSSEDLEARLIRQKLALSRIDSDEALDKLGVLLQRVRGFNLHLVLSESLNIGVHTGYPVKVADLLEKIFSKRSLVSSDVYITIARLYSMGELRNHWNKSDDYFLKGISLLFEEPKSVRWHEHSVDGILFMINENSKLLEKFPSEIGRFIEENR